PIPVAKRKLPASNHEVDDAVRLLAYLISVVFRDGVQVFVPQRSQQVKTLLGDRLVQAECDLPGRREQDALDDQSAVRTGQRYILSDTNKVRGKVFRLDAAGRRINLHVYHLAHLSSRPPYT